MYICKNCGQQYSTDQAVVCVRCGAPKGAGNQFCPCCGNQIQPGAAVCMKCGVDTTQYGAMKSSKSKIVAGLLGLFLGCYGVHNFYLGYTKKAIAQLLLILYAIVSIFVVAFGLGFSGGDVSDGALIGVMIWYISEFIVIFGVLIWTFVESIMIFCGKIDRDGKGLTLQ